MWSLPNTLLKVPSVSPPPIHTRLAPAQELFVCLPRRHKILELHLFKLGCSKDRMLQSNLVPEGLSDLCNSKGNLEVWMRSLDSCEIDKDALSSLGSKVGQ